MGRVEFRAFQGQFRGKVSYQKFDQQHVSGQEMPVSDEQFQIRTPHVRS